MRFRGLVLFALALILASCVAPPGRVAETTTPSPPATPLPTTPATGPITLTYWDADSNEAGVLLDMLAAAFMAANPGVVIERQHHDYASLRTEFQASLIEGQPPTVVRAPGEFAGPFSELELIRAADELYSREFLDQYFNGALAGASTHGVVWGLPDNFGGHLMLLYNTALVDAPPVDTDAWIRQMQGLTDATTGQYGLTFPTDEPFWLIPWLAGFGGWPLDAQGHVALDTAEMIEALWFLRDLQDQTHVLAGGSYEDAYNLFRAGKAAYIIDGAWNLARYEGLGIEVGVTALPRVSRTGLLPAPMATGRYWFLTRTISGAELEAATRFIEYMTANDAQEAWLAQLGRYSSLKDALRSPIVLENEQTVGIMAQLKVARGVPPALEMACAWQGIGARLPHVMAGNVSPDDAAPQMQAQADACVEDMGGYLTPTP